MKKKENLEGRTFDKYKWNLEAIYKDVSEFNNDYQMLEKMLPRLKDYENNLMDNAKNLYDFLTLSYDIDRKCEKLYMYANLHFESDTTNSNFEELQRKVLNLYSKINVYEAFKEPLMLQYDYEVIEKFYSDLPELKKYEFNLKKIFLGKKYTLSRLEEKLLASLEKTFMFANECYESVISDMTFESLIDKNKILNLTESNYKTYIVSNNRDIRKQAFQKLHKSYEQQKNIMAIALRNKVETEVILSQIRGCTSPLKWALFLENIPVSVYDNLVSTINENIHPLQKYLSLKKDILKLDSYHLYDDYINLTIRTEKRYSFLEAKDIVLKALSVFGKKYVQDLNRAFDERWIDVYHSNGKCNDSFSSGGYDTYPYIMLNYEGLYDDVRTLAHELGHSLHTLYSNQNNPYNTSRYEIFVAEVASTVNELLIDYYFLKNSTDKKQKLSILNNLLELYKGSLYRPTMLAEFEENLYESALNGKILTTDYITNLYFELNKKYYGKDVVVDEEIKYSWERFSQFFDGFYVYKYAIGMSAACYIVKNILKDNKNVENYLKFLSLGGSMHPIDELKIAGIDINSKELVLNAVNMFQDTLNEFKKLYYS